MKYYLQAFISIGIFILLGSIQAFAQISIDFPSDRAVFQRDRGNVATIYIAGSYDRIIDRVEAKLTPVDGYDTGFRTDWITIQDNLQGGTYSGSIAGQGGWYRLEVRGWKGDQMIGHREVSRVGIGEVFLIAGQSNAQGLNTGEFQGSPGAQDDRVSCIDFNNSNETGSSDLPYPSFSHLNSETNISPRGYRAWSWGKLGDVLVERYKVPVLFYNVAWTGSAIRNWRESITGTTFSVYKGDEPYLPSGAPYSNLKTVLRYYVPITGVRSVLWLQGEADNFTGTSTNSYFQDLKAVIEKSRSDAGKNISWMVSLTTYDNRRGSYKPVIDGQKRVINEVTNVFLGPNTDQVQVPRIDVEGIHFKGDGWNQLGDAWANQINEDFLSRSEPFSAVAPLQVTISCAGNNQVNLKISNNGFNSFSWNNGQNSDQIQVGSGSYRATARDGQGNIISSPEIRVYDIQPQQPTISIEGSNPVCKGNESILISNSSENPRWNTGSEGTRLTVSTAGEYSVTVKNVYGCESTSSKTSITILDVPLPAVPNITASGAVEFCSGGEVKLTSTSNVRSIWSTGSRDAAINVNSSGEFRVKAIDDKGCYSADSDPVTVKVNPLPSRPVVSLSGPSTFCANEQVVLTSSYDSGNTWSTNATTKTITIRVSGEFRLKQTDAKGCESTSDVVNIKVNPLPATPTVTSLRPTTFCERDFTTLQGSSAFAYQWSNGSGDRQIDVRESGNYTLSSKDNNGCVSVPSAAVVVTKNPLPPTPKIAADGPTTFCADLSVNLTSDNAAGYLWSNGASSKTINIKSAGAFTVRTINEFTCYSDPSNTVRTATLALPPAPAVRALGATIFCDGNSVNLLASNGKLFFWNNGIDNDTLLVTESGTFNARVKDEKGCFSPSSRSITVEAKPNPEKPEIIKTGIYALVAKNNLTTGAHTWKFNGNVLPDSSESIKAAQSGSYVVNNSVVYSATLTCQSEFSAPFVIFVNRDDVFVGYPNPTGDGRITIETLADLRNSTIQVIDSKGIIHKTFNVPVFNQPHSFNLSSLSNGVYFLRIFSGPFSSVQKIVIAK